MRLIDKLISGPAHLAAKIIVLREHWKARK